MRAGEDRSALICAAQSSKEVAHAILAHVQPRCTHPFSQLPARLNPGSAVHRSDNTTLDLPANGTQGFSIFLQQRGVNLDGLTALGHRCAPFLLAGPSGGNLVTPPTSRLPSAAV